MPLHGDVVIDAAGGCSCSCLIFDAQFRICSRPGRWESLPQSLVLTVRNEKSILCECDVRSNDWRRGVRTPRILCDLLFEFLLAVSGPVLLVCSGHPRIPTSVSCARYQHSVVRSLWKREELVLEFGAVGSSCEKCNSSIVLHIRNVHSYTVLSTFT